MSRNRTIDFFRFIFSLMIIAVHTDLFVDVSAPLYYVFTLGLTRASVPFFFIVSGFFFRQGQIDNKSRKSYFLKIIKYWLIFVVLDLLIIGPFYYHEYNNIVIFIYKFIFCGISGSYWYLTSLILSLLILDKIFKKRFTKVAVWIGLIFYLFAMTHDSYSFVFENTGIYMLSEIHTKICMGMPQAGFGESIFFLSIGSIFAENKEKTIQWAKNNSVTIKLLLILFTILLMVESYITMSHKAFDGNCYLSLIILPALLFIYALVFDPIKFDTTRIGKMSLYIYLIHPILKSLVALIDVNSIIRTLVCLIISIVLSYIITGIKHFRH